MARVLNPILSDRVIADMSLDEINAEIAETRRM
jgi:hypothetical protein